MFFYHIWAWRPSWSCDQDPANKLLFSLPMDAPHNLAFIGQAVSEKVIPESSFAQTIMGWSPQCYIPSFVEIGPLVLEKIFECFFTIYGRGGHLGHVIKILRSNFCSPYPWMLHTIWLSSAKRFQRRYLKL